MAHLDNRSKNEYTPALDETETLKRQIALKKLQTMLADNNFVQHAPSQRALQAMLGDANIATITDLTNKLNSTAAEDLSCPMTVIGVVYDFYVANVKK